MQQVNFILHWLFWRKFNLLNMMNNGCFHYLLLH